MGLKFIEEASNEMPISEMKVGQLAKITSSGKDGILKVGDVVLLTYDRLVCFRNPSHTWELKSVPYLTCKVKLFKLGDIISFTVT